MSLEVRDSKENETNNVSTLNNKFLQIVAWIGFEPIPEWRRFEICNILTCFKPEATKAAMEAVIL